MTEFGSLRMKTGTIVMVLISHLRYFDVRRCESSIDEPKFRVSTDSEVRRGGELFCKTSELQWRTILNEWVWIASFSIVRIEDAGLLLIARYQRRAQKWGTCIEEKTRKRFLLKNDRHRVYLSHEFGEHRKFHDSFGNFPYPNPSRIGETALLLF